VDKDVVKIAGRQGDLSKRFLKITNTGDVPLPIQVDLSDLQGFILFPGGVSVQNINLDAGKSQTIELNFHLDKDLEVGPYFKQVIVKSGSIEKAVRFYIEVEFAEPIFDIDVEIPYEYQKVLAGNEVVAEVVLYNLKGFGRVDVEVEYQIRDFKGNIIVDEHETLAVETKTNFVRRLRLPSYVRAGSYVFYATVKYIGYIGSSSDLFEVVESKAEIQTSPPFSIFTWTNVGFASLFLVMVVFIVIFSLKLVEILHHHRKQKIKLLKKETSAHIINRVIAEHEELTKQTPTVTKSGESTLQQAHDKLLHRLKLLRESYDAGYISEASYKKSKEKLERLLNIDNKE